MKMASCFLLLLLSLFSFHEGTAFIIPDEVPTLLSLIYSNIPTIKKGTDSRLGWGFRLGDRADFQVLVELGPQKDTQPLANQQDNGSSNKRSVLPTLSNQLYAKLQQQKQQQNLKQKAVENDETVTVSESPSDFLHKWHQSVTGNVKIKNVKTKEKNSEEAVPLGIGEVDAKKVIPPEESDDVTIVATDDEKSAKSKRKSDQKPLDDVSLDD